MTGIWHADAPGVLRLPSGRLVRGRGLRDPLPAGPPPTFAVHLLGAEPAPVAWASRWLRWRDFSLPADREETRAVLGDALRRATEERVEVACHGGRGRTGCALALLAALDGVPPQQAVRYVRDGYHHRAVETPWQRHLVRSFLR